uniref:Cystatin domain-containing protein n=1 Tax=Trichuris muris TaxID=70415 RepID=A0A5S6QMS5_TRIMR
MGFGIAAKALLFGCTVLLIAIYGKHDTRTGSSRQNITEIAIDALYTYNVQNETENYWRALTVKTEDVARGEILIGIYAKETSCTKKRKVTRVDVYTSTCPLLIRGTTYMCYVLYNALRHTFDADVTLCEEMSEEQEKRSSTDTFQTWRESVNRTSYNEIRKRSAENDSSSKYRSQGIDMSDFATNRCMAQLALFASQP